MAVCLHNNEKYVLISSDMLQTIYQKTCEECGHISYFSEQVVPDIFNQTYEFSEKHND